MLDPAGPGGSFAWSAYCVMARWDPFDRRETQGMDRGIHWASLWRSWKLEPWDLVRSMYDRWILEQINMHHLGNFMSQGLMLSDLFIFGCFWSFFLQILRSQLFSLLVSDWITAPSSQTAGHPSSHHFVFAYCIRVLAYLLHSFLPYQIDSACFDYRIIQEYTVYRIPD